MKTSQPREINFHSGPYPQGVRNAFQIHDFPKKTISLDDNNTSPSVCHFCVAYPKVRPHPRAGDAEAGERPRHLPRAGEAEGRRWWTLA